MGRSRTIGEAIGAPIRDLSAKGTSLEPSLSRSVAQPRCLENDCDVGIGPGGAALSTASSLARPVSGDGPLPGLPSDHRRRGIQIKSAAWGKYDLDVANLARHALSSVGQILKQDTLMDRPRA